MKKKIPTLRTDKEAEDFVADADLTEYDLSGARPARLELDKKLARVKKRLPAALGGTVKTRAEARGIPYQRFIGEALEQAVSRRA